MKSISRLFHNEEGSNLVESAIGYAFLLIVLIGTVEFSYAFYSEQNVADASRQASRWAAVRGSTSCANDVNLTGCNATRADIQSFVRGLSYPGVVSSNLSVTTGWLIQSAGTPATWSACTSGTCNVPGNEVQVTVSYAFPISIPYWKSTSITFGSTGTMVIAQ
jgi:Flp pilus assembly protein TadG